MEQRLVDLIHHARRWGDGGRDYLPTLGCSKCGIGCMPLCGLGLNRKITPMETKEVKLKSRKTMLETGKNVHPLQMSFVTGTDVVIMCERALDCIEEREIQGNGKQWVFVKPIPTLSGLVCKDCQACVLCGSSASEEARHNGKRIKVCIECADRCPTCQQTKVRHHSCCSGLGRRYFGK